jgi:hypothetical protein
MPDDETPETTPTKAPKPADVPETFPLGLPEYAATTGLDPLWVAGLAAYAGTAERYRTEWDALLAEFQVRPVQNS